MYTLNNLLNGYSSARNAEYFSSPWSPQVDAPPSTDTAYRTATATETAREAYRYLAADRITYSGMRLIGDSLTSTQLSSLYAMVHGAQRPEASYSGSAYATYHDFVPGLQSHILGHMSAPILPQRSVRLPENIVNMTQAHAMADLARRLAGPQKLQIESASKATTAPEQSLFKTNPSAPSKEPTAYDSVINALATATPAGGRSSAQYLGVAVPVKQTTIMKRNAPETDPAASPRTVQRFPLVLPPLPDQFVSLAHSAGKA
jgi:hypothetical protein